MQSVRVTYGDGGSDNLGSLQGSTQAQHVYASGGTYTATATATDNNGASTSSSTVIVVASAAQAVARYNVTPASPARNVPATFDGSGSTSSSPITNYRWVFGDGDVADGGSSTVQKTYSVAATYNTSLTITDSAGRSATATRQVIVTP
jgi:PKD repeat protein